MAQRNLIDAHQSMPAAAESTDRQPTAAVGGTGRPRRTRCRREWPAATRVPGTGHLPGPGRRPA